MDSSSNTFIDSSSFTEGDETMDGAEDAANRAVCASFLACKVCKLRDAIAFKLLAEDPCCSC